MNAKVIAVALGWAAMLGVFVWAVANSHSDAGTALDRSQVAQHIAMKVQEGQVEACHAVGDPLLRGEIALWREKLISTQNLEPSDFPGLSPGHFHRLIHRQRRAAKHHIRVLNSAPSCEERF